MKKKTSKSQKNQNIIHTHEDSCKDFEDEGLQDVMLVHDLKGDANATELLTSRYLEDEVYHVLYEQHLDVEVPPILEPVHEEVLEVEKVQHVPEEVPLVPQVDVVPET
ncbi:unnamed protein product [Lactuca saligna]|uniref:Uncharacterized protein n=1 Tax=Lactuca saligna TaxID=75948 RepID=A0AA35ZG00_LACSI|nr:unnamed protein product [Lactuca saligna]